MPFERLSPGDGLTTAGAFLESGRESPAGRSPIVVRLTGASTRVGGRTVWRDVGLELPTGEIMAVLGPNGAGKSTLLKTIVGLLPLAAGSIDVLGQTPKRARSRIGYVPQRRHFGTDVRLRGWDLVRLGLDGDRWGFPVTQLWRRTRMVSPGRRVDEALDLVGARALARRPIGELSGGEQQRILIAQALVRRPQLLLLDEPLESLDLAYQSEISRLIQGVSNELHASVLLVAHDVNPLLPYVDRICYLAGGRAAVGTPDKVITSRTLSALYGTDVEVIHARNGQILVAGRPEGVGCADHHEDKGSSKKSVVAG